MLWKNISKMCVVSRTSCSKFLGVSASLLSTMLSSSRPWLRSIVLFVTLVASFCVYGHYNFYRDPGSIFFDEHRAFQRQYSTYRQAEIAGFSDVRQDTHAISRTKKTASICASFPSVERQGSQYLPVSATSPISSLC